MAEMRRRLPSSTVKIKWPLPAAEVSVNTFQSMYE
jgi:hypothetical protein